MTPEAKHRKEPRPILIHEALNDIPLPVVRGIERMNKKAREEQEELPENHQLHRTTSKEVISQTADEALNRAQSGAKTKALILGSGNFHDIPLADIATTFDETVAVDIDFKSSDDVVGKLPEDLQKKVRVIGGDVSGIVAPLSKKILQASKVNSVELFISRIQPALIPPYPDERHAELGSDYTFISSHLLTSQLMRAPQHLLLEILENRYGVTRQNIAQKERFASLKRAINMNAFMAQRAHIEYLRDHVADTGTIHLADTYTRTTYKNLKPTINNIINPELTDKWIEREFTPIRPQTEWDWKYEPNHTEFHVVSHALKPRQS